VRGVLCGLVSLACVLTTEARAQSPGRASPDDLFPAELFAPLPDARPPHWDVAIAFWFKRDDPIRTLRHQAYDRRKGEYTSAVDDWLRTMRQQYPEYGAYVRYVDVGKRDMAEAVRETVTAARERLRTSALTVRSLTGSSWYLSPATPRQGASLRAMPRVGGTFSGGTPSYSFPTPFPYPRPHP